MTSVGASFGRLFWSCLVSALLGAGCGAPAKFVLHAAEGQLDLYRSSRPIADVVKDHRTPEDVRQLLSEVPRVKHFALEHGLAISDNYDNYVALHRRYVVWFVNASDPLVFYPKAFWFPIVGSFPGLGWFDEGLAKKHAAALSREGWDVSVRGVRAFSTGGWFSDPILSSMFTDSDNAVGYLVNVILHESLHATVLIKDQQFYNESLASFVGDQMTLEYLSQRFGPNSDVMTTYLEEVAKGEAAEQLLSDRYQELEVLYASELPVREKLLKKQKIMRELYVRLGFDDLPTNATLIGTRLYDVGQLEFAQLLKACGRDWNRFIFVTASVHGQHFEAPQQEQFAGLVSRMAERGCQPLAQRSPSRYRMH